MNTILPSIDVVIPVFNAEKTIGVLFGALMAQSYPAEKYRVIFVDNDSEDKSFALIERLIANNEMRAELVLEGLPGSYAARNKGISLVDAEIIAFTDADCVPDKNWLREAAACIKKLDGRSYIAGSITLFPKYRERMTVVERYEMVFGFSQGDFRDERFAPTANMIVSAEVFRKVGVFNSSLKSKGDYDWNKRANEAGYKLIECKKATVLHPARRTFSELVMKTRRIQGGKYDYRLLKPEGSDVASCISTNPISSMKILQSLLSSPYADSVLDKISLLWVMSIVVVVLIFENIRLNLGFASRRS